MIMKFFYPYSIIFVYAFLLSLSVSQASETEQVSPEVLAQQLQEKYNSLTSLVFTFDQVTRTGSRKRVGQGEAEFYRYRPPREEGSDKDSLPVQSVMRWNYTLPDAQIIISDGETLSIYTEKDKQLIRTPAKELESDITYAFFAGTRNLLDDFTPLPPSDEYTFSTGSELRALLLVPRVPHNQIQDVQVWFDDHYLIRHLLIRDHFDSVTELNFPTIKADSLTPGDRKQLERIITFPLPPDTEIISH